MPAIPGCGFYCRDGDGCVRESYVCDGFPDCSDGSDEVCKRHNLQHSLSGMKNLDSWYNQLFSRVVSSTGSKADAVTRHHYKRSTTRMHRPVVRKTTRPYWDLDSFDSDKDWYIPKITMPPIKIPTIDPSFFDVTAPSFHIRNSGTHNTGVSAPVTAGGIVGGIFFLTFLLAVCRLCYRLTATRVVRVRTQHPSVSTQALIGPELGVAVGSRLNSASREQDGRQVRGSRTVLIRARSTNDLRSDNGQQDRPGASQQQQQQGAETNERAERTTEALHLMVRDGPWLTTRTLRPMIPDQPNIPLFIEQSNVRRLDDSRGIVVSTPPQLMMYVDGEFVWIPASRVPEALNFIALLNLQTEEGPSPAAPEHIEDLPTVSIQQETVDTGGRCNVCLEDFSVDEQVRELPCRHLYHSDCIVPWLQLNGTCPACREPISGEQETDNTTDAAPTNDSFSYF